MVIVMAAFLSTRMKRVIRRDIEPVVYGPRLVVDEHRQHNL